MLHIHHILSLPHILFKLAPEMTYRGSYRPCSGFAKRTNCFTLNFSLYIPKQINVSRSGVTFNKLMQNFFHPSCSFAARGTLSAGFMMIKAREIPEIFYDAGIFIHYNEA